MLRGTSDGVDERGASTVLAVILLIGITLVGVIVVIAAGWMTIDNTNQQANVEIAEESMLQIDSAFQQSSGSNTTITIPSEVDGHVSLENDATYNLTVNENSTCSTGPQNLSSVQYESNGQTVGYEGGGVWRMTDSGATMTSPPDITYADGSLTISFVEINGRVSAGQELRASEDASEQTAEQRTTALALYSNLTYSDLAGPSPPPSDHETACEPSEIQNATLRIEDSQYSRAWAQWARDNHDGRLVTTNASGTVESGDTVEMYFLLGDVSDPYFNVTNVSYTRPSASDPLQVTATVTNTGGLNATQSVSVAVGGAPPVNSTTVTLDEDEQTTVTLDVTPSGNLTSGDQTVSVSSANDTATGRVDIDGSPSTAVPSTTLTVDEPISNVSQGEEGTGTVIVENTGGMTGTETVTLTVDGTVVETWQTTLDGGEQTTIDLGPELPTDDAAYNIGVQISGDIAGTTIPEEYTVAPPGRFTIQSQTYPSTATLSDTIVVEASVENTGNRSRTGPITIRANDPSGSAAFPDDTVTRTLDTDEDTVEQHSFSPSQTGAYQVFIETPTSSETGTIYVEQTPSANFAFNERDLPDDTFRVGEEATIRVTVNNTGDTRSSQDVTLEHESGEVISTVENVTLDPGEDREVTFSPVIQEPFGVGDNGYTVSTANSSTSATLGVSESSVLQCVDGTCTNTVGARVEVRLAGAELEGINLEYDDVDSDGENEVVGADYTYPTPTTIRLVQENATDRNVSVLWENVDGNEGDVNDPEAERRLTRDGYPNVFNTTVELPPGTNTSIYATSYYCYYGYDPSGVTHPSLDWYGETTFSDVPAYECDEWYPEYDWGEWINISSTENSDNVVVLNNSSTLPSVDEANPYQIGVDEMLNGRVDDDTGTLNLETDERIYLFELSQADADPDNAPGSGDPDYNDAVVSYQVLSIVEEQYTPPSFEIVDVNRPDRVARDGDADIEVTVRNNGGRTGSTRVQATFAGEDEGTMGPITVESNSTETVEFDDIDTDRSAGQSYNWTVDALANDTEAADRRGSIYIGSPASSSVQVARLELPSAVRQDAATGREVAVHVINVGGAPVTNPTITLTNQTIGTDRTRTLSTTLAPGGTASANFTLPSDPGLYTYEATTTDDDASVPRSYFVGESDVQVRSGDSGINIGSEYYEAGSQIQRNGSIGEIQVYAENVGSFGGERDVDLTVTDSEGNPVVDRSERLRFGRDDRDLRSVASLGNSTVFTADLDPGYYTYTIEVQETDGTVDDTVTGDLYLRNVSDGVTDSDDSPVDVGSSTVTVAD